MGTTAGEGDSFFDAVRLLLLLDAAVTDVDLREAIPPPTTLWASCGAKAFFRSVEDGALHQFVGMYPTNKPSDGPRLTHSTQSPCSSSNPVRARSSRRRAVGPSVAPQSGFAPSRCVNFLPHEASAAGGPDGPSVYDARHPSTGLLGAYQRT